VRKNTRARRSDRLPPWPGGGPAATPATAEGPLPTSPDPSDATDLADLPARAEEVRDYLVAVRGGAPFLSSVDDRLLLDWLRQGVPVTLILASIDQVADQRRRKRSKSRLTLAACKKTVEKQRAGAGAERLGAGGGASAPPRVAAPRLATLATEVRALPVPPALAPAATELAAELELLAGQTDHADTIGRAATAAVTRFQARAWEATAQEHPTLRAQAETQLASLRSALSEPDWAALVDEVAHDLVRQRTPVVCARQVWDRLGP